MGNDILKTRIAPTPSGMLHLGNAFSFVITALVARKRGAKILLRIDDLDRQRFRKAYLKDVFHTLHFLGLEWNEGPTGPEDFKENYSQVMRLPLYEKLLENLREKNLLFACDCSRSELAGQSAYPGTCRDGALPLDAPNVAWRLRTDESLVRIKNWSGTETEVPLPQEMKDFVVRRKDAIPAYQVASLADDVHFKVHLVVRGEDLYPSTLAQLYLARALGLSSFLETRFCHHALLRGADAHKLSKSHGAGSLAELVDAGFTRADFFHELSHFLGFKGVAVDLHQSYLQMEDLNWQIL